MDSNAFFFMAEQWQPTPVLLPGESHGRRSLVSCSPWGRKKSNMTERLHFHFSLSCIGEGNGNPVQYSCLENPRDGGAWWAAVYGVAWSRTRLKQLSSSSRDIVCCKKFFLIPFVFVSDVLFGWFPLFYLPYYLCILIRYIFMSECLEMTIPEDFIN